MRPILIIDAMNIFLRHYMVNQSVNTNGELVGGVLGFLKSLKYLVSDLMPKKVFIVWEQGGGCKRRRLIYPEYKANRARQKDFDDLYKEDSLKLNPQMNEKNKFFQIKLLTTALNNLPVCQLYVPEVECDDIIAYLCKNKFQNEPETKIIVSSDKDFYQLLEDPNVKIYDPGKKIIIDQKYVKETFSISARNIALARCLAGDNSDNIEGVPGVGLKTVAKRFPEFVDEATDLSIDWVLTKARGHLTDKKPIKCYQDVSDNEEVIKRNWKLMFLGMGSLSLDQMKRVDYRVEEFKPKSNQIDYLKTFIAADLPITRDIDSIPGDLKCLLFA